MTLNDSSTWDDAEDVGAIVRERDGLRAMVKRLDAENRRLRTIVAGYTEHGRVKPENVTVPKARRARRQSYQA
jgi:hypothetical protein